MISRVTSSFQSVNHQELLQMYPNTEDLVLPSMEIINYASASASSGTSHSSSLLFNLSILKDKVSEVQTLVSVIVSPNQSLPESTSMAISSMNSTIQEIIVTATSMMLTCQHMSLAAHPGTNSNTTTSCTTNKLHQQNKLLLPHSINFGNKNVLGNIGTNISDHHQGLFSSTESETLDWFSESYDNNNHNNTNMSNKIKEDAIAISENNTSRGDEVLNELDEGYRVPSLSPQNSDIIELDARICCAKYTHYCQVCGKGFKRDANLRMHMRAHGDEYKTNAALSNPNKNKGNLEEGGRDNRCLTNVKPKRYSCPQEGCRWNKKHAKFQPLKSMICAKNHYKRSHCPKMYVCKRCNQKQFSVLSDLRTHEKHCGDLKWQCSCGTSFSRKDKLLGHVALFVGHQPAITNGVPYSEHHTLQINAH